MEDSGEETRGCVSGGGMTAWRSESVSSGGVQGRELVTCEV